MKRHFYTLGLMLAATFTLTNCAQEIDNPNDVPSAGIPFEIVATSAETKTVNDGLNTKWVAGDQINIFHAVAETNTYVSDGAFTVAEADVATGRFTGTLSAALESDKVYDWYALYPYSEYVTTPGEHDEGYTYIGHSKGLNQSGYDSMASLKESVCPLYGIATAVPEGTKPSMTMNHISSIVAINVTNATEEALTVTTASLTAEEDIVGSYFIDITKSPVVCTPSAANYVNNTATVNVSGGTELAQGESAILYLAIKPFTAATGEKLVISVNGYSKELTMTKDVTFTAGKIKTLNFSYDKVEEPAPEGLLTATLTFDADKTNRKSYSTSEQVWEQNGITFTNTKASSTNNIADYANPVRLYKSSTISVEAPGYITKIEFNSASGEYLTNLKNSISGATVSGTVVTVELDGSSTSVEYTLSGGQARLNSLTVTYSTADYVPPTLESIAVSGDYKTEFTQGATFSFGGVVTATYDDESTKNVTDDCTFSGYDMSVVGDQTVTVTYEEKTVEYNITVSEKPQGGDTKYYVKVSEAPTNWIGTYLVVFPDNKARSYVSSKDLTFVSETVLSINDNKIEVSEDTEKDAIVITANGTGYKMKLSDGKFLTVPASNACGSNTEASASVLTIKWTSSGVEISGVDSQGVTRYLCANGTYYRMYKSVGSYKLPVLYKLED